MHIKYEEQVNKLPVISTFFTICALYDTKSTIVSTRKLLTIAIDMIQSVITLFILLAVVSSGQSQKYIDDVVLRCREECDQFAATEDKYILKENFPDRDVTDLSGGNTKDSQMLQMRMMLYEKQKLQRPFECIANYLDPYSLKVVEYNPHYQELVQQCKSQPQPQCDASTIIYRTLDGTCNNLLDPPRGSIFSCLRRYVDANYDGVSGLRRSVCRKPLPGPREISLIFNNRDVDRPSRHVSQMSAFFGQFAVHDMTDVPKISIGRGEPDCSIKNPEKHPECKPILIKKNDPFYSKFGKKEFPDARTAICDTCTSLKKRVQTNFQSSYLDLSHVYGVLKSESDALRTLDGTGKLRVQKSSCGRDILPPSCEEVDRCGYAEIGEFCFKAGDRRVNQHSPLASMHTLFHLEHNRIADELKRLNPHWEEEKLFQEARKINIAAYQIIVFKEYLPTLLPSDLMEKYNLGISDGYTSYNISEDATLWVEFNTAGFRLHTLVGSVVSESSGVKGCGKRRLFKDLSFDVSPLYNGEWQSDLQGMAKAPAQDYDAYVVDDISKHMYRRPTSSSGYDIFALNIDRGRDNGLPTYCDMINYWTNGRIQITSFKDLEKLMDRENIKKLKSTYCDVRDIDLIVGLWSDRIPPNSIIGEYSAEIIGSQFSEIKNGDRFYVEHQGNFNIEQLQSLKKATLSSIICRNTDVQSIQKNALSLPSDNNPIVNCSEIEKVNLNLWKDVQQLTQNFNWGQYQPIPIYPLQYNQVPIQQFQQVPIQQFQQDPIQQFQQDPIQQFQQVPIQQFQQVPIQQFQQVPF